jgi:peptide deformylase
MSVRGIRLYGDPVLRARAKPVPRWTEALRALARDMIDTMRDASGVGLAAPQVGESVALLVAQLPDEMGAMEPIVLANPELVSEEGKQVGNEGCLSLPEIEEEVERAERIRVRGLAPSGEPVEIDAEGYLARILLHEIDHLNGILLIDRISPLKRRLLRKTLDKIRKRAEETRAARR